MFFRKKAILQTNQAAIDTPPSPAQKRGAEKATDQFLAAISMFESDSIDLAKQSAKKAWHIAYVSWAGTVIALLAVAGMAPLKTVEPFVIRTDNTTGYSEVVRPLSGNTTHTEEIERYFVAQFISNRESFEWSAIDAYYDAAKLLSSDDVGKQYLNILNDKHSSPLHVLGKHKRVLAKVLAVTFLGPQGKNHVAQVRLVKQVQNTDGTTAAGFVPTFWIATVMFNFEKKLNLDKDRLINPLGFQVINYRIDREHVENLR